VNQVAKNKQLLDIAKDGFQFVTKFFEVINVSAAHIYHSALELCPVSSIVRRLYYRRRTTWSPKVVIGTSESWDPTIAISGKNHYDGPCTWSPCGQFIAAQTRKAVEIRNQLTLEPVSILQPTEAIHHFTGPLAYSPDGRSIACASDTAVMVWDIQTGGVAEEIRCSSSNISLVWSSDGRTVCTINSGVRGSFIVHTHDVSSGTTSSPGTLESGDNPHLWTDDGSFWVMATVRGRYPDNSAIDIFSVGPTLIKTQSFDFPHLEHSEAKIGSFSPTTFRISILDINTLRIFDIQNPGHLLANRGNFLSHSFSPDGRLFAASHESGVHVWEYHSGVHSGHYLPWREFRSQGWLDSSLRFSPTSSSIVGHSGDILQVLRLHLPAASEGHSQYVGISRSGAHVATAYKTGSIVKIIDLLAQTLRHTIDLAQIPCQTTDADMRIKGLVLTGNVLLVANLGDLRAWLLIEEGVADGVISGARCGDSIWTISQSQFPWMFRVEGQVGVIKLDENTCHVYHTETGEVLHPTRAPQYFSGRWHHLSESHRGRDYLCYHNLSRCDTPPEDNWQTSRATLRDGWVKDPEGKHRLWVPVEWRTDWDPADWRHDVTTQFSYIGGKPVITKF
jgi:hypothetical protein